MSLTKVNYIDNSTIITAKNLNDIQDNIVDMQDNIVDIQDNIVELQDNLENIKIKPKAGFIYPLASSVVPEGFLLCDGAAYSRTEYPELFAAIGTIYGSGDGINTFNVPNLQTRVPVGKGEGYELGDIGGEENHTLTIDEMPSHSHKWPTQVTNSIYVEQWWDWAWRASASQQEKTPDSVPGATQYVGGSNPHNNMQPYTVVNYIIATGKDTGVNVSDIVSGAQALPLGVEYGGTGAANITDIHKNLGIKANARNLLDNSDFRNPVNQRGQESYTANVYTIDRWQIWNGSLSIADGYITVDGMYQFLELPLDKVYTLAVCRDDGNITIVSGSPSVSVGVENDGMTISITNLSGYVEVVISGNKNVVWAALYEGEYTAETLPEYQPKGYGAELTECQRYFQKGGQACTVGTQYGSTSNGIIRLGFVNMRIAPTIKITGVSGQGWGNMTADKLTSGWSAKYGNTYTINYLVSGDSSYIGQTVGVEYEASADL